MLLFIVWERYQEFDNLPLIIFTESYYIVRIGRHDVMRDPGPLFTDRATGSNVHGIRDTRTLCRVSTYNNLSAPFECFLCVLENEQRVDASGSAMQGPVPQKLKSIIGITSWWISFHTYMAHACI